MPHPYPTHAKILKPGEANPYNCDMCILEPVVFNTMVAGLRADDAAANWVELQNRVNHLTGINEDQTRQINRLTDAPLQTREAIRAEVLAEVLAKLQE